MEANTASLAPLLILLHLNPFMNSQAWLWHPLHDRHSLTRCLHGAWSLVRERVNTKCTQSKPSPPPSSSLPEPIPARDTALSFRGHYPRLGLTCGPGHECRQEEGTLLSVWHKGSVWSVLWLCAEAHSFSTPVGPAQRGSLRPKRTEQELCLTQRWPGPSRTPAAGLGAHCHGPSPHAAAWGGSRSRRRWSSIETSKASILFTLCQALC